MAFAAAAHASRFFAAARGRSPSTQRAKYLAVCRPAYSPATVHREA
jgi:hypothetical protein